MRVVLCYILNGIQCLQIAILSYVSRKVHFAQEVSDWVFGFLTMFCKVILRQWEREIMLEFLDSDKCQVQNFLT